MIKLTELKQSDWLETWERITKHKFLNLANLVDQVAMHVLVLGMRSGSFKNITLDEIVSLKAVNTRKLTVVKVIIFQFKMYINMPQFMKIDWNKNLLQKTEYLYLKLKDKK